MELALICVKQICIMFLLIAAGYLCGRTFISRETSKELSKLLLDVVNPVLIFMSYQIDPELEKLHGLLMAVLLSAVFYIIAIGISELIFHNSEENLRAVEKFSAVYSNCGFMGMPLIYGLFGSEGVFYLTGCLTCFNILVWTHGIIIFRSTDQKLPLMQTVKNVLLSPSIIVMPPAFLCFIFNIRIPSVIAAAADYIGSMNTPLAMLVAGITIAGSGKFSDIIKNKRIYYISAVRLLIIPIIFTAVCLLFKGFGADDTVFMTIVTAAACPAAATGVIYAVNFGKNSEYASHVFAATTVLSCITLPTIITLTQLVKSII